MFSLLFLAVPFQTDEIAILRDIESSRPKLNFKPQSFLSQKARHVLARDLRELALQTKERLADLIQNMEKNEKVLKEKTSRDKKISRILEAKALEGMIQISKLVQDSFESQLLLSNNPKTLESLIRKVEDGIEHRATKYLKMMAKYLID